MDRYRIEKMIGPAADALKEQYPDGKLEKTIRSKFSAFGAAVLMSGLLPAMAYYRKNQPEIIDLLEKVYSAEHHKNSKGKLFDIVRSEIDAKRRGVVTAEILDMSVSLKMACNLFELTDFTKEGAEA